jgi:hypothetical protein
VVSSKRPASSNWWTTIAPLCWAPSLSWRISFVSVAKVMIAPHRNSLLPGDDAASTPSMLIAMAMAMLFDQTVRAPTSPGTDDGRCHRMVGALSNDQNPVLRGCSRLILSMKAAWLSRSASAGRSEARLAQERTSRTAY